MASSSCITLKSEVDTLKFGAYLAKMSKHGDIIALSGDLGSGKTVVARGFIKQALGIETEVSSPTFNLVNTYESDIGVIWHFDLYRLNNAHEITELGIDEALSDGISIIEWPEKAINEIPATRLNIFLEETKEPGFRLVNITSHRIWKNRILQLKKEYGV